MSCVRLMKRETRERNIDEIMAEMNNKQADLDLGYAPDGEVLTRFEYNKVIETYEDDSGSSTYQDISYLFNVDVTKRVVIIEGTDAMPDEWFVINEKEIDGTFIYKQREKVEKTTKAEFGNTWLLSTQESKQLEYLVEGCLNLVLDIKPNNRNELEKNCS